MSLTVADLERIAHEASHWPSEDDRLLSLESFSRNLIIDWEDREIRSTTLWEGYKEAGDSLLNRLLEENMEFVPINLLQLIYPALFCYRHFIELALKQILMRFGLTRGGHDVRPLWKELRKLIERNDLDVDEQTLDVVSSIIRDLSIIDEKATWLRYPSDVNGKSTVKVPLDRIDLEDIRGVMGRMHNFLGAIDNHLSECAG